MLTSLAAAATVVVADKPPRTTETLATEVKWSVVLPAAPATPPLLGGAQIYVALQSGIVVAHQIADGTEVWRRELRTAAPLAFDAGRLFVASGDAIYALNADLTPAWHADAGALTAPMLAQDGWLIAAAKEQLSAFRVSDGTVVWRRDMGRVTERAAIEEGNLFVPTDTGVLALDLKTGKTQWERRLRGAATEILAFADRVYLGASDKHVYCLDAEDGHIMWRQRTGAFLRGKPAADESRVYVVGLDNLLRAFDRVSGSLKWSPKGLPFRPTSGPFVAGHVIAVAGTTNEIRGIETVQGQPAGTLTLPDSLATLPAYRDEGGVMWIVAISGSLTQQWKLSLIVPAPPTVPSLALEPLTVLPGLPVPNPSPPR